MKIYWYTRTLRNRQNKLVKTTAMCVMSEKECWKELQKVAQLKQFRIQWTLLNKYWKRGNISWIRNFHKDTVLTKNVKKEKEIKINNNNNKCKSLPSVL